MHPFVQIQCSKTVITLSANRNLFVYEEGSKSPGSVRATIPYRQIQEMFDSICAHFPKCQALSGRRKKAIKARFENGMTVDDFKKLFEKAEASSFLRGKNDRARFPEDYGRYIEVFGGAGWVLFGREPKAGQLEVYNDFNGDLVNLIKTSFGCDTRTFGNCTRTIALRASSETIRCLGMAITGSTKN